MSGWAYSHERDTPALAATAAKVTGAPVRSSSRSAWTARARVSSCRCLAAATMGAALSGRIGLGLLGLVLVLVRGFLLVFSSEVMMLWRLVATWRFISATRVCPRASAAVMICRVARCWARCWGRNSAVVTNTGQGARQALACGQDCWIGSPQ